ncbi:metallophosphoesterase [Enterococcus casseliflavus]
MIYHFLDRQFNPLTFIDTEASDGIVVADDIHNVGLTNRTLLNTLTMDIYKQTGPRTNDYDPNAPYESSLIKEANHVVFQNDRGEDICLFVRALESEDESVRPISCVDIGTELRNGSASIFTSNNAQYVDYYINRELYDTGWSIGVNELGSDIKRLVDTSTDETPLARIQRICEAFDCEVTFTVDFQNMKVIRKLVNIYYNIGSKDTGKILYSGVDVISMQKSVDIDNVITAIEDTNHGFDSLGTGDGRFFTRVGESIIYDREANALYGRGNTSVERFSGFITGRYASTGTAPIENYNELRAILETRSQPTFSAEVDMLFNDGDFEVGDWLTFIDEEYNPSLRVKARVLNKELHRSNPAENKATIGNYQLLESLISSDLTARQQQMNKPNSIYLIKLIPDNGVSFVEGEEKTTNITAMIYKDGVDITSSVSADDILWFKVDKSGNHDTAWEDLYNQSGPTVQVTSNDFTEVSSIRCALTIFDNHFVQAIYFLNGLRDVARKVLRLQTKDTITSVHISDTHYATDSIGRGDLENYGRSNSHIKNVAEFTNFVDVDYVVLNGDTHDGSTANKNIALSNYREAVSTLGMSNAPYFVTWGNHCNNSWGDNVTNSITKTVKNYQPKTAMTSLHGKLRQVITHEEMYQIATRPSTIFDIVENPLDKKGYYYYDVPDKKNRVIILNAQDVPISLDDDGFAKYIDINVSGYRQAQIKWLYDVLKNTPTDTTVSIYQHYPFGKRYKTDMDYYAYNYEMIDGIIDSFVTGGTYSRTYNANTDFTASISCDFEGHKGTLAFLAHGHMHNDRISKDTNGTVNYSIGCSVSRPKKDQGDRPLGVLEEDLWDVIVLNTKTRHVDLIRFGKGTDRSFDY